MKANNSAKNPPRPVGEVETKPTPANSIPKMTPSETTYVTLNQTASVIASLKLQVVKNASTSGMIGMIQSALCIDRVVLSGHTFAHQPGKSSFPGWPGVASS